MWLVQLYKAENNTSQSVHSFSSCNEVVSSNQINPDDYEHEIALCQDWDYSEKKKLLVLGKGQGTVLTTPENERMIRYYVEHDDSSSEFAKMGYFIIFEYKIGSDFLMDFYVHTQISVNYSLFNNVTISRIEDFIEYVKNKTLSISFGSNDTPKYTIHFDDDCKYYKWSDDLAIIIKKPFLFMFQYDRGRGLDVNIYATPKLIDDINNHASPRSYYDPDTDHPLSIDNIVSHHFNANNMRGIQHSAVNIYEDDDNVFGYSLIRALFGTINYYVACTINIGDINLYGQLFSMSYRSLYEAATYTYLPLLRPKLDADGHFYPYPQYDPLDEDSEIRYLRIRIALSNSSSIQYFGLFSEYITDRRYYYCYIYDYNIGQLPSWYSENCDFRNPFRFVGATDCSDSTTDNWNALQRINNANYLFMISKSPSSDTYSIKGVGCNEETQPLDFNATFTLNTILLVSFLTSLSAITFSGVGYAFARISQTLSSEVTLENSDETCFVLFSDKLIEDENDFINIYDSVRNSLRNAIICYFGVNNRIPPDLRNKVIHSDAIVTDLDTNEQMPLVIKYIRYAKRLHKLFNE